MVQKAVVEQAKVWLLYSGIQNQEGEHTGAFNSWYDINKQGYEYAYSEITGYGISILLFLYERTHEKILLERAKQAAKWLMKKASHKSGGILTRYFYEKETFMSSFDSEEIFSFDCGMVLNGMTNLYQITQKEDYLTFCKRLANFMINRMQKPDGSFYAVYDAKNERLIDDGEKWSTQSGALHAKHAIGFLKLYEMTREEKYKEAAEKVCDNSLQYLRDDGRVINFKKTGNSLFHPHCYAAEGWYVAGKYLNKKKYKAAAEKATLYLFENQLASGGIPSMFRSDQFVEFERTDILGQALRMGTLFKEKIANDKLQRLADRLLEFQVKEGVQKGGFIYGYDDRGNRYEHINSWCTMFALQALILQEEGAEKRDLIMV